MDTYFTLDGDNNPQPTDQSDWREFFHQQEDRRVVGETIAGDMTVRTEFTGLKADLNSKEPTTFQTLIFHLTGVGSIIASHYATWDEAEIGHKDWVETAREVETFSKMEDRMMF